MNRNQKVIVCTALAVVIEVVGLAGGLLVKTGQPEWGVAVMGAGLLGVVMVTIFWIEA